MAKQQEKISRRSFSISFKQGVVNAILAAKTTVTEVAAKYRLSRSTIDRWIKAHKNGTLIGDETGDLEVFDAPEGTGDIIDVIDVSDEVVTHRINPNSPNNKSLVLHDAEATQKELAKLRHDLRQTQRERDLYRQAWLDMK